MKNILILLTIFFVNTGISYGQKEFMVKDGSKTYWAKISVEKFVNNDCSGAGTISLFDKSTNVLFQTFKSENLCFYITGEVNPSVSIIELYGEQSPLIFEDFNFDGYEDLAISNGNNGSYGMPSFDVYLHSISSSKFIKNSALTEIASTNLGMFRTDQIRKRIITYNKSGCCWHIISEYEISTGNSLIKNYELEEDATNGSEYVTVTERKFKNGEWKNTVNKYKIEEYYKDR